MCHEYKRLARIARRETLSWIGSQDAQLLFLLLAELLGVALLGGGSFDRLGLVGTGAGIRKAGFDVDISFFAQLGEIGAERGLQLLVIESVLDAWLDRFQRRNSRGLMLNDFQDHVTLFGADHVRDLARFHGKGF